MLFGEDGRRREDGDLLAVHRGDERRAHGDFGLAVAGVAADETVHGLPRGEVLADRGDRGDLIRRLLVGEGRVKGVDAVAVDIVGEAGDGLALRLGLEERGGERRSERSRAPVIER